LSEDAKGLLDRADILINRFSELSGSLSDLADYLSRDGVSQNGADAAAQMQERVRWMTDDLRQIKREIREDGAQGVYEDLIDDYSDIAQTIAARAQSLRSSGGSPSSEPSEGPGSGQLGSGDREGSSGSGGSAATALMVVGGAALTAWVLFRESGSGQDTEQAAGGRQSPGEVVPAGGALIGQH
jgi:hypothetical protein